MVNKVYTEKWGDKVVVYHEDLGFFEFNEIGFELFKIIKKNPSKYYSKCLKFLKARYSNIDQRRLEKDIERFFLTIKTLGLLG
jgi:hypothetical protein